MIGNDQNFELVRHQPRTPSIYHITIDFVIQLSYEVSEYHLMFSGTTKEYGPSLILIGWRISMNIIFEKPQKYEMVS